MEKLINGLKWLYRAWLEMDPLDPETNRLFAISDASPPEETDDDERGTLLAWPEALTA